MQALGEAIELSQHQLADYTMQNRGNIFAFAGAAFTNKYCYKSVVGSLCHTNNGENYSIL